MGSPGNLLDADHRGPAVNITTWLCFTLSTLFIIAKVYTKLSRGKARAKVKNFQLDDALIAVSLLFSLAYCTMVSQQVGVGLGQHPKDMTAETNEVYEKLDYASQFAYISTICVANAAGILFGLMLEPVGILRRLLQSLLVIHGIWAMASILAVAFQCHLPHAWQSLGGKCVNQGILWTVVESVNGLINTLLAVVLSTIVWILQLRKTKCLLILLFMLRVTTLAPIVFKITILQRHSVQNPPDSDHNFDRVDATIASILILTLSIMATCLPFRKPVMEQLQPGWSMGQVLVASTTDQPYSSTSNTLVRKSWRSLFQQSATRVH